MEHELKGIRYQSKTYAKLEILMNRVSEESLREEHRRQIQKKAVGVDGVTKLAYGEQLDSNVGELIARRFQLQAPAGAKDVYPESEWEAAATWDTGLRRQIGAGRNGRGAGRYL